LLFGRGQSGSIGTLLFGRGGFGSIGTVEANDIAMSTATTKNRVITIDRKRLMFRLVNLVFDIVATPLMNEVLPET